MHRIKLLILMLIPADVTPLNKMFDRVRIADYLHTRNVYIGNQLRIAGNMIVDGTINGSSVSQLMKKISIQLPVSENMVARFADDAGNMLKGSSVQIDDAGNISGVNNIALTTISKDGVLGTQVAWPNTVGAANTFLGSDGAGNLIWAVPAEAGNVDTALLFANDNRIIVTDTISGSTNIKETGITLDNANNITGANTITATAFNGTLNGNAATATTAAALSNDLAGEVVGDATTNTTIDNIGGILRTTIINNLNAVSNASDLSGANTLVKRSAGGNFTGNVITANTFNGNLSGNATTATTATNATNLTTDLAGEVAGPATNNEIDHIGVFTRIPLIALFNRVNDATNAPTPETLVFRDINGDIEVNDITADGVTANNFNGGTFTGNVTGDVTGDVTGNITGNVIGNVTGNVTGNVIGSVTGAASENVLKIGDTMTGALTLPPGTPTDPILRFTGSSTSGFSAPAADTLSFITDATERMQISSTGTVSINQLAGSAGIVHNAASGNLSSSLIVNADIDVAANIADTKLATITTAGKVANSSTTATASGTNNTIVLRDGSGHFTTNMITITGTTTNATDVATKDYVDTITGSSVTQGANVGTGNGQIFRNKTGTTLNFKTLSQSNHIVLTNNANEVNIATDAVSTNTADTIVLRDGSGNFSAGTITANFTGDVTGNITGDVIGNVTGNVTGAASENVLKAGDTMSGDLQLPPGSAGNPSLQFTGSETTGLSAPIADTLSISTDGFERMRITATGTVSINQLAGSAGIVHNDVSGNLSSSLIVNADIDVAANIADTKLATITTAGKVANSATTATASGTNNTIVLRDGSGHFTTNMITITGTTTNATDVATKDYVDTITGSSVTQGANVGTGNGQIFRNKTGTTLNFKTLSQSNHIVLTNNANEVNIATDAVSTNTADTIVLRDGSGNFAAGTITANLTGNVTGAASDNVLKTGDTMTNALQLPGGTGTTPMLRFTGSTTTGLSTSAADTLSFITAAAERMRISSSGTVSINQLAGNAGIVHNDVSGNLSSSLIVNADINAAANIADTKLATITTAGKVANSATTATSSATNSAIVQRDGSGNFSAGTITANLTGNVTGAASDNVLKVGDTMSGDLQLPPGSAVNPSLQFTGNTNTGLSALTANTLTVSANGNARMTISDTAITTLASLIIATNTMMANQSIQSAVPTSSSTVTALANTSILILKPAGNVNNVNITFPPSPINGQLFTLMLGSTNTVGFNNFNGGTGGATVINPMVAFNPTPSLLDANAGKTAATYIYISTDNRWYRMNQ